MKKILILLSAAILAASCMDLSPKAQMSDAQVWSNADNFKLFSAQFYGWTRDFSGCFTDGFHSDLRSDFMCSMSSINVYSQGTNSVPATDGTYNSTYKRIYYTNLLIKNAETYANPAEIAEPVGEAYFFRAYLHFELVQMFGDVILVNEPLDINSERLYGKRDDRLVVVKSIISDLQKAADLLPDTPSQDGRVCKQTANALLSRVALYEGSWQKYHKKNTSEAKQLFATAASAAKLVMDSNQYQLFFSEKLGPRDSYRYLFTLENVTCNPAGLTKADNKEYIFARRHDETLKTTGVNITHAALGNQAYVATRKLANMYRCQDGLPISKSPLFGGYAGQTSEYANRDNRMRGSLLMAGQSYWNNDEHWRTTFTDADLEDCSVAGVNKQSGYCNYKWATERQVNDYNEGYDWPIIRYAEVLLNYAEAVFEANDGITDRQLDESLNLVRGRSNPEMAKLSNKLVSDNGLSMLEEIRAERSVELYFEGFRIDDLKRWKTAEIEMPMNLTGVKWRGTWYETGWADQSRPLDEEGCVILYDGRTWGEKNYLLPLPSDERQLNPSLGQNPGWE